MGGGGERERERVAGVSLTKIVILKKNLSRVGASLERRRGDQRTCARGINETDQCHWNIFHGPRFNGFQSFNPIGGNFNGRAVEGRGRGGAAKVQVSVEASSPVNVQAVLVGKILRKGKSSVAVNI